MIFHFGPYEADTELYELRRSGAPVPVEPQVFDLLVYLIEHRDRAVTKSELYDQIWDGRIVSESTLSSRVKSARKAICDNGRDQKAIKTLHGRGFRFIADVSVQTASDKDGAVPPDPNPPREIEREISIAVLPFQSFSQGEAQDNFADGIAEDISVALSGLRWLRVISRNSAAVYRDAPADIRTIGRELGARYAIEGSVRVAADRIRISVNLTDTEDGGTVWATKLDRKVADLFSVQDEVAELVAGSVGPELESSEHRKATRKAPSSIDAWDLYHRAWKPLYTFKYEDLEVARELLERSIALDPEFAPAHARLGYVHIQEYWYGGHGRRTERVERAISCAERAIGLDDRKSFARFVLGRALVLKDDVEPGLRELRRAIEFNPSSALAHFGLGQSLVWLGDGPGGLESLDTAVRLSPRDPHIWAFYHLQGWANALLGNFEEAQRLTRLATTQPNATHWPHASLVSMLGWLDRRQEARAAMADLHAILPDYTCRYAEADMMPAACREMRERFVGGLRRAGLPE